MLKDRYMDTPLNSGKRARELIDERFGWSTPLTTEVLLVLAQAQFLREISNNLSTLCDILNREDES